MKKENVAIISPANLPLPAVKGGAVESLIDNLCEENEKEKRINLDIFSIYDKEGYKQSLQKNFTEYTYIRIPIIIKLLDKIMYFFSNKVLLKGSSSSFRYFFQHMYFILIVAYRLRSRDYDRVVIENYAMMLWCIRLFGNRRKYADRYYYHMHNLVTHYFGCKDVLINCRKILGVSNYILKTLPNDIRSKANCEVLRNGINTSVFKVKLSNQEKKYLRKKYNLSDKKVVLFVGRLVPEKGIEELLEAWKSLKITNSILLIVGGAFFKTDVKSSFENRIITLAHQIGDSIRFTGYVNYKDIPKFYALADVIVIPSIWDDPAPLTILESLTANKPLITTDSGGIPEYLNNSGLIVKRDSKFIKNLACSIKKVLSDKQKATNKNTKVLDLKDYYVNFISCLKVGGTR